MWKKEVDMSWMIWLLGLAIGLWGFMKCADGDWVIGLSLIVVGVSISVGGVALSDGV